jgi:hypothetical protein
MYVELQSLWQYVTSLPEVLSWLYYISFPLSYIRDAKAILNTEIVGDYI